MTVFQFHLKSEQMKLFGFDSRPTSLILQLRKLSVNFIIGIINTNIIKSLVVTRTIVKLLWLVVIQGFLLNVLKQVFHFG